MKAKKNRYGEITSDFKEAFKYFNMSSQKGDPEAMFYYGRFLEFGNGHNQIDSKEAAKLYKKSYENGSLSGCAFYGYSLIDEKFGGELNEIEGLKLIKYSCDHNNPTGLNCYGYLNDLGIAGVDEDVEKAFKFYKKAADLGDPAALSNVGNCYKNGHGVQKNVDLGLKYLKLALEEGSSRAAMLIASTISDSDCVSKVDREKSAEYFRLSVDMGSRSAIYEYCCFLFNDTNNLQKNAEELRKYLSIGYKLKEIDTMQLMGALYLDGGVVYDRDQERGVKIWKECVELGSLEAANHLADLYQKGSVDISPNQSEAQKYRNIANNKSAKSKCCLLI